MGATQYRSTTKKKWQIPKYQSCLPSAASYYWLLLIENITHVHIITVVFQYKVQKYILLVQTYFTYTGYTGTHTLHLECKAEGIKQQ